MEKYIKKYWWVSLLVILIPFGINEIYKIGGGYITVWSGADVLSFYGSLLSFLGSLFLGGVALLQNNRLLKLEEHRFDLSLQPLVTLVGWGLETKTVEEIRNLEDIVRFKIDKGSFKELKDNELAFMTVEFRNTSKTHTTFEYLYAYVYDQGSSKLVDEWHWGTINQTNDKVSLGVGEIGKIAFCCSKEKILKLKGKRVKLYLYLSNEIYDGYTEMIQFSIWSIAEYENSWYINLRPEKHNIKKK